MPTPETAATPMEPEPGLILMEEEIVHGNRIK